MFSMKYYKSFLSKLHEIKKWPKAGLELKIDPKLNRFSIRLLIPLPAPLEIRIRFRKKASYTNFFYKDNELTSLANTLIN